MVFSFSSLFHLILLLSLLDLASSSSSSSLSDGIFESQEAPGRALLQAKQSCTVDFENQNYTVLTNQCKGPLYEANLCCAAFKQFACPFVAQINDLTTDCASTVFSYINLYGKYPPGLFANECKEGKEGLDCSAVPPAAASGKSSANNSNAQKLMAPTTWLVAGTFAFVYLLIQLLLL
ncbi:hypothetical protein SAY86_011210 [Trapa natans]|uniref:GPI-anchored protein LLG1-like domain-containing protein n=1 Tax=Trapa natans TaxID=22666 RepID=A0AAN7LII4_TRANT|nr:hypothetical protein SAY86_011210 [Trapa natans]